MKIIAMERETMDGDPVEYELDRNGDDCREWWCVIETKEEEAMYEEFLNHLGEYSGDPRGIQWNKMMIEAGWELGVSWGDDDVYGYIHHDEDAPKVGEEMVDSDGDKWVRVK